MRSVDTLSPQQRSERMSRVRSKDTKPELRVRRLFHSLGYRFRLRAKGLPCKPDFVLAKWETVVLVHGCFWHRHPGCPNTRTPKSKVKFWEDKFDENVQRDKRNQEALEDAGWRCFVVWECELDNLEPLSRRIQEAFPP